MIFDVRSPGFMYPTNYYGCWLPPFVMKAFLLKDIAHLATKNNCSLGRGSGVCTSASLKSSMTTLILIGW